MALELSHFAYLLFHIVILGSIGSAKLFYRPMILPSLKKFSRIIPVIIFFLIWDSVVTTHWWDFNPTFTLTVNTIFRLPLEEITFFITVPFALLTLTENLHQQIKHPHIPKKKTLVFLYYILKISFIFISLHSFFQGMYYTSFICGSLTIFLSQAILFHTVYLLGLGFTIVTTLMFNYYLTALPVVTYNPIYKTSIHIGTIPIEDFAYGILLYVLVVLFFYEKK